MKERAKIQTAEDELLLLKVQQDSTPMSHSVQFSSNPPETPQPLNSIFNPYIYAALSTNQAKPRI